jgi:sugar lactone lactonase YvrE
MGLVEGVNATTFATLPDADAYPAAVTVGADSTVYTGSYSTGAIWAIDPAGNVRELPNTRAAIGAVSGLVAAPDGTLYVVDQNDDDPRTAGGDLKRVTPEGIIEPFAAIDDERGFIAPDDVELDGAGRVYVTDRGRNEVWRFEPDGVGALWWSPGEAGGAVTGLAYDATGDMMIVTDPETSTLYRVSIADASGEVLYQNPPDAASPPGFDGAAVAPDGALYVAALAQNGVVTLRDGGLVYLAGNFRGASDVAFAAPNRLYVTNFDQSSLVLPLVEPRLPFALDVVTLDSE